MKNIITLLLIMVISLSVFGQTPFQKAAISKAPQGRPVDKAQVDALKRAQMSPVPGDGRAVQRMALDYDLVDEFATNEDLGVYERFIWNLNTNYSSTDTSRFDLTWGVVLFDTITGVDSAGNFLAFPRNSTDLRLDSIQILFTHANTTGNTDRIKVTVFNWTGPLGVAWAGPDDTLRTDGSRVMWDTTITTTTSLSPGPAMLAVLTVYPDTQLTYPNTRFAVGVQFYGDTANTFTLLAGYGNRCGEVCFGNPSVIELNSLWRLIAWQFPVDLTGVNSIAYDCNQNNVVGEAEECEEFPIQNFSITPWITIDPVLTSAITTSDNTVCPGETVQLSVAPAGGTPPYDVAWSPVTAGLSTPFSATTNATMGDTTVVYTATITDDDGTVLTKTVTITVNNITINAGADVTVACGATTNLLATPGGVVSGANFAWSNGPNTLNNPNVGPGCYQITATNSFGCSAEDEVCVTIPGVDQVLSFTTSVANNIACRSSSALSCPVVFTNTSKRKTGWDWTWDFGGGVTSTLQDPSFPFETTGTIPVTLSADSAGCSVSSFTVNLTVVNCPSGICIINGIEDTWLADHVKMYPNPTTGLVTVDFKDIDGKDGTIGVYDVTGKLAMEEQISVIGDSQKVLDLRNLSEGVYFVKVQLGKDMMMSKLRLAR